MTGYSYSISLRISHPSISPEQITSSLNLTPSRQWTQGEPRMTRGGRSLDGVNRESFWTTRLVDGTYQDKPLSEALDELISEMSDRKDFFVEIADSGGQSELFIGWFFDQGNSGDEIGHVLMGRLAALRIDLSFDVYPEIATAAFTPPAEA